MNKSVLKCFLLILMTLLNISALQASADYSIVFVHLGNKIPDYASTAILQARDFNREGTIILLANQKALDTFSLIDPEAQIVYVACESLAKTPEHKRFKRHTRLDSKWRDGFWLHASERFLYLQDLIVQHDLKNVFHLEYDNLLYVNLEELLPFFKSLYPGMAITMDNEERCVPGFVFVANKSPINLLAAHFADKARENNNDMFVLGSFKRTYGKEVVDNLPIIFNEYVNTFTLKSQTGHTTNDPMQFCKNIDLFQSIFDGAALGQYFGGIDPRNGPSTPGFINESCLFDPSNLTYEWITDSEGRKVPFAVFKDKKFRINNLHIHCKDLKKFASRTYGVFKG